MYTHEIVPTFELRNQLVRVWLWSPDDARDPSQQLQLAHNAAVAAVGRLITWFREADGGRAVEMELFLPLATHKVIVREAIDDNVAVSICRGLLAAYDIMARLAPEMCAALYKDRPQPLPDPSDLPYGVNPNDPGIDAILRTERPHL